jgi:hypothetical protein
MQELSNHTDELSNHSDERSNHPEQRLHPDQQQAAPVSALGGRFDPIYDCAYRIAEILYHRVSRRPFCRRRVFGRRNEPRIVHVGRQYRLLCRVSLGHRSPGAHSLVAMRTAAVGTEESNRLGLRA